MINSKKWKEIFFMCCYKQLLDENLFFFKVLEAWLHPKSSPICYQPIIVLHEIYGWCMKWDQNAKIFTPKFHVRGYYISLKFSPKWGESLDIFCFWIYVFLKKISFKRGRFERLELYWSMYCHPINCIWTLFFLASILKFLSTKCLHNIFPIPFTRQFSISIWGNKMSNLTLHVCVQYNTVSQHGPSLNCVPVS